MYTHTYPLSFVLVSDQASKTNEDEIHSEMLNIPPILIPHQIVNETHTINYILFRSIVLSRNVQKERKARQK